MLWPFKFRASMYSIVVLSIYINFYIFLEQQSSFCTAICQIAGASSIQCDCNKVDSNTRLSAQEI